MVYLQQDAFDEIDACMSRERQLESFHLLKGIIDATYNFKDKDEARSFFTELTSFYKNWNYSAPGSTEYDRYRKEIVDLATQHGYSVTSEA